MSYSYNHLGSALLALVQTLLGMPMLLGIAAYVLTALALYTVAKRRGLKKPWLAWIPVVSCYLLGSLSDQYRYVVHGENKSKRKILLVLNILTTVMCIAIFAVLIAMVVQMVGGAIYGLRERELLDQVLGLAFGMLGLCLPLLGVAIAYAVFRYMALYDLYKSMDPSNSVLFLVLSILFGITEPFFLFFSRNKDDGMPPRKQPVMNTPSSNDWVETEADEL
ncbi:MAG: hypothetical protein SOW84_01745 [Candidatus Faecousia sp.]|nr:hypothetical protein [Candidatus Faecousia sp.]